LLGSLCLSSVAQAYDRDSPRPSMSNCDIRGREDDLDCREGGEWRQKAWQVAGDLVGLGVLAAVYNYVSR